MDKDKLVNEDKLDGIFFVDTVGFYTKKKSFFSATEINNFIVSITDSILKTFIFQSHIKDKKVRVIVLKPEVNLIVSEIACSVKMESVYSNNPTIFLIANIFRIHVNLSAKAKELETSHPGAARAVIASVGFIEKLVS